MSPESKARLQSLFNAGSTPFFMTGAEGSELVSAGYIIPDATKAGPVPGSCQVTITESGIAALSAPVVANDAKVAPVVGEVRVGIAMPAPLPRGNGGNLKPRTSSYPFDQLTEPDANGNYSSFHIKLTPDNPEPWKAMASNVSAANKRSEVEVKDANGAVVMETVEKKTLQKGPDGKALKGPDGKSVYSVSQVTQAKTVATKRFVARRVNESDPDGAGVRVFRVPLDFQG